MVKTLNAKELVDSMNTVCKFFEQTTPKHQEIVVNLTGGEGEKCSCCLAMNQLILDNSTLVEYILYGIGIILQDRGRNKSVVAEFVEQMIHHHLFCMLYGYSKGYEQGVSDGSFSKFMENLET
jgi:hypothetical protein